MDYRRKSHSKFLIIYHIIFVVKYRKPLLLQYGEWIKAEMCAIAHRSDFRIQNQEVDKDHIHLLVESDITLSPIQIISRLKQGSSAHIHKFFPEIRNIFWKKKIFWSDGYFCCSIGNASLSTIERYINEQG